MKEAISYEVPRLIWSWANERFDHEFCADIWMFLYLREKRKRVIRRTALILLISFLLVAVTLPLLSDRYPISGNFLMVFLFVASIFTISSCRHIENLGWAILRLQENRILQWARNGEDLINLVDRADSSHPKVRVVLPAE